MSRKWSELGRGVRRGVHRGAHRPIEQGKAAGSWPWGMEAGFSLAPRGEA